MKLKLLKIKEILKARKIDYLFIPINEDFLNNRTPLSKNYNKTIEWLKNFSDEYGYILLGREEAILFTHAHYAKELKKRIGKLIKVFQYTKIKPHQWLLKKIRLDNKKINKLALVGSLCEKAFVDNYVSFFSENLGDRIQIDILKNNPVDEVWKKTEDTNLKKSDVFIHQLKYSGRDSLHKRQQLKFYLEKLDADCLIINRPSNICWLLNIRGNDNLYTPIPKCKAIFYRNGTVELFIDTKLDNGLLSKELKEWLNKVKILDLNYFKKRLEELSEDFINILTSNKIDYDSFITLNSKNADVTAIDNCPCNLLKTIKNDTEIKGALKAQKMDGLFFIKFFMWLEEERRRQNNHISELDLISKIKEIKSEIPEYVCESFKPIVCFDGNGSIVHYSATEETNKTIRETKICLIDVGSQYKFGTTDTSRTISFKKPSKEQKENYTRVLKGHIALATTKFYEGTKGKQLDCIARQYLHSVGLDYNHCTGHGVGSFLDVHEDPCYISDINGDIVLREGMIFSIEPGYYKKDEYGIRIENLYLVKTATNTEDGVEKEIIYDIHNSVTNKILSFVPITLVPLDYKLIDSSIITQEEKETLVEYHEFIFRILYSDLNKKEQDWLRKIIKKYKKIKPNSN